LIETFGYPSALAVHLPPVAAEAEAVTCAVPLEVAAGAALLVAVVAPLVAVGAADVAVVAALVVVAPVPEDLLLVPQPVATRLRPTATARAWPERARQRVVMQLTSFFSSCLHSPWLRRTQ
jgi:hypothetical protein